MNELAILQSQLDQERRKVDVDHFDITIREIVRMAEETPKELITAPAYQRKFRWSLEDESKLIESLFLGLPVPSIFVATNANGTWELVDGLQRVSTLLHYVSSKKDTLDEIKKEKPLKLINLEKTPAFIGTTFESLPTPIQLAFYKRSIRVTALSDKSDLVARFDLFERLNTGGVALSPQEVRACIFRGKFADFIRELAETKDFRTIVKLQAKRQNDGTMEELVLKFFAYLFGREEFKGNVKKFLNDYMEKSSGSFDFARGTLIFNKVVATIFSETNGPFQRKTVNVTPLNQLEGVMVGIGQLIIDNTPIIEPTANWIEDRSLVDYSTGATNTRKMLDNRIKRAMELFSGQIYLNR